MASNSIGAFNCSSVFTLPGTFVACGLVGVKALAEHINNPSGPEMTITRLFISDATSDSENISPLEDNFQYHYRSWSHLDTDQHSAPVATDPSELREKEREAQHSGNTDAVASELRRHSLALEDIDRKYDLRQQRALLLRLLPQLAPSLETLVYIPRRGNLDFRWSCAGDDDYEGGGSHGSCAPSPSDPRHAIILGRASFPNLKRLTIQLDVSSRVPFDYWSPERFPALTHLHFIDNELSPAMRILPKIHTLPPSLTHLRLSGFQIIAEALQPPMYGSQQLDDEYIFASQQVDQAVCSSLVALNATILLQNTGSARYIRRGCHVDSLTGECNNEDALRQDLERTEGIREKLRACGGNIHILPESDMERQSPVFTLSLALEEGGWLGDEKIGQREWEWEGRGTD